MTLLDIQLFVWLNAVPGTPAWRIALAAAISNWLPALLVLLLAAMAAGRPAWRRTLWAALVSLLIAWVSVRVFREYLPMPRPAALDIGTQWLPQGERPGFPSLHATGAFAVAVMVLRLHFDRWGAAYVVAAALVALSRVFLGLHFPTDIVVGAMLGALIALVVERALVARQWRVLRRAAAPS
ncbi:phosphatase PAP2 family protein [Variovorax dokdonensis]|uniref:Phosphatase PAP2 family protein n=1 Tax=Variovorax dokdonensis TaxID=344883 RepID=A0ABT7NDI4_9BURK|nr:phosphatase PAP2 family protein [Variovorax dokdonensis]MDM0046009.1 phosphatase PAP2 family protein [Variovorax dokdonensis]